MKVLVLVGDRREALRLDRILSAHGHDFLNAHSVPDLDRRLHGKPPDVVIVGHGEMGISDLEARLEDERCRRHIYTIAALPESRPELIAEAWASGVDDILYRGVCAAELLGRVGAPSRIRRWTASQAISAAFDVNTLSSIRGVNGVICEELGELIGSQLSTIPLPAPPSIVSAAEIALTLAVEDVEIKIGVGLDGVNLDKLGMLLFGEPVGPDVLADCVREFANTAGGAFRRRAQEEGVDFATGIPMDAARPSWPTKARYWKATADDLEMALWVTHRDLGRVRVTVNDLREGMVLARDVCGTWGGLLVPAGAVVTERTAQRLIDMVGTSAIVEITHTHVLDAVA